LYHSHGEQVKKALKNQGANLRDLSPSSPDFSLLGSLRSKLKIILRSSKTTNYQKLGKIREFAFGQVKSENLWNWRTPLLLYLILLRKGIFTSLKGSKDILLKIARIA